MIFNLDMCPQCIWRKINTTEISGKPREMSHNYSKKIYGQEIGKELTMLFWAAQMAFCAHKGK